MGKILIYISDKCPYSMKLLSMIKENGHLANMCSIHDIQKVDSIPQGIKSVPTILDSRNKLYCGNQAFEFISGMVPSKSVSNNKPDNEMHDAFEFGFGTNAYSFLNEDNGCHGSENFAYLSGEGFDCGNSSSNSMSDNNSPQVNNEIDSLIQKRNMEVPQYVQRK